MLKRGGVHKPCAGGGEFGTAQGHQSPYHSLGFARVSTVPTFSPTHIRICVCNNCSH